MNQLEGIGSARYITRSASRKIKNATGLKVNLALYNADNLFDGPHGMLHVVAIALGRDPAEYRSKARRRETVDLRFIAALLLRLHYPGITLAQIGGFFGGQDHSSVINGIARAGNLLCARDEKFTNKYNKALKSVKIWLERQASGYASAISA
jgi:chromosomal replication initiation ATPase DnaA